MVTEIVTNRATLEKIIKGIPQVKEKSYQMKYGYTDMNEEQ